MSGKHESGKVLETLESLGFEKLDAQVYVFLGKKGPQKTKDIVKALKIPKQKTYAILRKLQSKGIVNSTLERPSRFSVAPFDRLLDIFVKEKMDEAKQIQQNRNEILLNWQSIAIPETRDHPAKFTIFEGRNYIYSKIRQMIEETRIRLSIIATVPSLVRAEQFGLFDAAARSNVKSRINLRFLVELSEKNLNAMKLLLKKTAKARNKFEIKAPDLEEKLFARLVIRDAEEVILFISSGADRSTDEDRDEACLWTDCKSLVNSFTAVFEDLWRNSTAIEKRMCEIEKGKPTPKTLIFHDEEIAERKYNEIVNSASSEILMMTSSKGLLELSRNMELFKNGASRGITTRIVAPLSNLNVQATGNLSKYCEIKHVPTSYTETTIIDGKHMFQFKNPSAEHKDLEKTALFENTFYTNEPKCVEKTESWFREIWKKAEVPSTFTADSVHTTMPSLTVSEKSFLAPFNMLRKMSYVTLTEDDYSATLTERDVLDKVIASHKNPTLKGALKYHGYASSGLAVIRLHDQLRLPNVLIRAWHFDKQSIFGEGDLLMIHLWLESPKGYAFVPVAIVHEQPEMTTSWKEWMAGTPAAQNVQLVRKDQIQVQTYGKTMLAGWTNTIPLATKSYTLPPSTITLEGYGTVVTGALTQVFPSGVRSRMEFNGFEAFVTFIHGTTKYSGPSTEGFVFRETLLGDPKSGFYKRAQL